MGQEAVKEGHDAEALELLQRSCHQFEHGDGCLVYGLEHKRLKTLEGNETTGVAIMAYEKACALGTSEGCFNMGLVHEQGSNRPVDLNKAAKWYSKGWELDQNPEAGRNLASILFTNDTDKEGAIAIFTTLCDAGHLKDCGNLGTAYVREKDYVAALPLLKKACVGSKPDVQACFNAGVLIARGEDQSVTNPAAAAEPLFKTACSHGHEKACQKLAPQ